MAYEKLGTLSLDYMPCRYGASKLLFRGPRARLDGRYAAFLGGTETYGKFIAEPFPALIAARTGAECVNLGWTNAGVDVFLHDPEVMRIAARAQMAVIQALPAQNMANRFYSVHPRRNDRFIAPSTKLRDIFPEVDFTEFHFTRHMLHRLRAVCEERFALVQGELQTAWVARMRLLIHRIDAPVVVLWMSAHDPGAVADGPYLSQDPAFVTRPMLDALRPSVRAIVEATASAAAQEQGTQGMIFSEFEATAAAETLGPAAHREAAAALAPLVSRLMDAD
ncbi:hypothetical protein D6850_02660 [Roseovarius spongiae]|uniref:DUF6473 domain-containing protein n=1 Tax=Roseovarius spongiae TaxID=2320272 RepID=A0A3A8BB19_9RHOB|nr:DUF6473 family protein [Roseovarius spongiae]RKF16472.1 hypothetical protein D6850_02660 [Roseovarius spongiae]